MAWKLVWTEDDAGVADGLATLDESAKVVQDPANAQEMAAAGKIPIAMLSGKLAPAWQPVGPLSRLPASINADPSFVDNRLAPFEFKALRVENRAARRAGTGPP